MPQGMEDGTLCGVSNVKPAVDDRDEGKAGEISREPSMSTAVEAGGSSSKVVVSPRETMPNNNHDHALPKLKKASDPAIGAVETDHLSSRSHVPQAGKFSPSSSQNSSTSGKSPPQRSQRERRSSTDNYAVGNREVASLPSRLYIPQSGKFSPSSSRNSSISGKSSPPRSQRERGGSTESLQASLAERIAGAGGRRLSGAGLKVGSPGESASSRLARRDERGNSMSTPGSRGLGNETRSSLSNRTSPRTSQSPDTKRSSMSFEDFVVASNTELSLLEMSRLSASGKRPRDRDALRVAVRVRPLIERERGSRAVTCDGGDGRLVVVNPVKFKASADAVLATASAVSRANMATSDWLRSFDFDRVFWSTPGNASKRGEEGNESGSASGQATQQSVFNGLGEKIVEDALNGFNCSCFAYGHTGSGKTYSMFGCGDNASLPKDDGELAAPPKGKAFGLVPRVCYSLLSRLQDANTVIPPQEPGTSSVGLSVQFIEIYNDKIRDLLHPGADSSAFRVREHPQTGPYIDNLVPVQVESWSQLRQLLALGMSARAEADTPENSKSSRGHAILTLEVCTTMGLSRVQMVDLAGSEREVDAHSGSSNTRRDRERGGGGGGGFTDGRTPCQRMTLSQRLRETAQIKKALSNLGIIIKGLSRGDTPVGLPFRDSILTWLLKEALSGRAHTTMLATVSPSSNSYVETMHTLKYAERLKRANAHLNKDSGGPRITKPSDGMKKEMEGLVEQLGADGIEAKRQVLYQTVSDPQQRIAKLTAKDPRRRRTSSGGGSSLPMGGRCLGDQDTTQQRRTSFPGSPPSQHLGWDSRTPSRPVDRGRSPAGTNIDTWGSPINTPDDCSVEGGMLEEGREEEKHDVAVGIGLGGDDADELALTKADVGDDSADAASTPKEALAAKQAEAGFRPSGSEEPQEPEEGAFTVEPSLKLYSDSEGESVGNGTDPEALSVSRSFDGTGRGDRGDASVAEGAAVSAAPDGGEDDTQSVTLGDRRPDTWLQSPGSGAPPNWAGTSSSEDPESPHGARLDETTDEAAPNTCPASEVDDAATPVPTYHPDAGRGNAASEPTVTFVTGSSDTYVGGSADTFFGGPSYTLVTGSAAPRNGEAPTSGGMHDNNFNSHNNHSSNAEPSAPRTGEMPHAEGTSDSGTGSTATRAEVSAPGRNSSDSNARSPTWAREVPDTVAGAGMHASGSTTLRAGDTSALGGRSEGFNQGSSAIRSEEMPVEGEGSGTQATGSTTVRVGEGPPLGRRYQELDAGSSAFRAGEAPVTGARSVANAVGSATERAEQALNFRGTSGNDNVRSSGPQTERVQDVGAREASAARRAADAFGAGSSATSWTGEVPVEGESDGRNARGSNESTTVRTEARMADSQGSEPSARPWTGEAPVVGEEYGRNARGSTTVRAGEMPPPGRTTDDYGSGSSAMWTGEARVAGEEDRANTAGSATAVRGGEVRDHSTAAVARTSSAPSRRITWGVDEVKEESGGPRGVVEREQERHTGRASHPPTMRTGGLQIRDNRGGGHLGFDSGPTNTQQHADDSSDSFLAETLNSSVESGGGAAALAASGVFDVTSTSAEYEDGEGGSVSIGDADSLEGMGAQEEAWAQQYPVRNEGGCEAMGGPSAGRLPPEDLRRLVEDLMRQIQQLKATNASLVEELQRLKEELRKSKESEEEAWALGDDTAKEFQSRLAAMQRELEEQTARARNAERNAQDADARAESDSVAGGEASRLLDDARARAKQAEQRASEAEAREEDLQARENDLRAHLDGSLVALEEQDAVAGEAQGLLDEARRRVNEAERRAAGAEAREAGQEARANDALAQLESSRAALEGQRALNEAAEKLLDEARQRRKEAEQRAARAEEREAQMEARAKDARLQTSGSKEDANKAQRLVDESRRRVGEAEQCAAEARARGEEYASRAEDFRTRLEDSRAALADQAAMTEEAEQMLDKFRRRVEEAEQRAAEAEARGEELEARINHDRVQLEKSNAALKDQATLTEEAQRRAQQTQAALEATESGVDAAVAASQRAVEQEREEAAQAEVRANRAAAKAKELASLVDEHEDRLRKARASLDKEGTRADGAEVRERRAVARADELLDTVKEKDKHVAKMKGVLEVEGARADEMEKGKNAAELRVAELELEMEQCRRELDEVKREAKESLDAVTATAEADAKHATQRRNAVIQERDRTLEQVEAERREVLRLAAELNRLRASAEQDAAAARGREAALTTLLASETEAARAEQVEVEGLLSLISSAQDAEDGDGTVDEPTTVSIPAARVAVEAQQAKSQAARRRLQALEDENVALRRRGVEAQARLDEIGLLEEERDFLLLEKDTLVDRLESLEARQGSLQERERQAKNREDGATLAKDALEDELRSLKDQLSREVELREREAKEFGDRLTEKDEQAAQKLGDTLKQVMEGVKSQAGHIRDTVTQLEDERDRAIGGKDALTKELEDAKCQLDAMEREKTEEKQDFEEQMKQSARERAALWLAVNKLDVLEAAKDAAIKELQKEGEDKARALKVLQAHNAGLTRELGQVDMSLMQALEDNGLTLDSVRLQNTTMSRRLGRRRPTIHDRGCITNGHASGESQLEPEDVDSMGLHVEAQDRVIDEDHQPWQRTDSGERQPAARPLRSHSRHTGGPNHHGERSRAREQLKRTAGAASANHDGNSEMRKTNSGSVASFQADRWDPAINTIEREIEQLSERLDTGRVRPVSSQPDPSRGGKRLRLRGAEVSPPKVQDMKKRERGSLA